MIPYLGDFRLGDTVEAWFPSHGLDGASITIGTNGTFRVFCNGALITGPTVTFEEDKGGYTGSHRVTVLLTGTGVIPFAEYSLVLQGAVVDGKNQNVPIAIWSVFNRGTEVVQRTTLSAVTANGGTLAAHDRVNVGDYVRTITASGTRPDFGIIETFNGGTGVFTMRNNWRTAPPAIGTSVMIYAVPAGSQISAADIADGALTSAKFADDFLTASKIADNAIGADQIAGNAIDAGAIAAGAITNAAFAAGAISDAKLAGDINTRIAATALLDSVSNAAVNHYNLLAAKLPAALVGGRIDADIVGGIQAHNLHVPTNLSIYDLLQILLAFVGGKSNGFDADGGVVNFRDVADSKNVISATLDEFGNRSSVTLDP